jgi:hypothetical protein
MDPLPKEPKTPAAKPAEPKAETAAKNESVNEQK